MPDDNPQTPTAPNQATPEAKTPETPAAPAVDELADMPDDVRETARMLRENYNKLPPKAQAEVLFAATNAVRNTPAPTAPKTDPKPAAKPEDDDEDRPMTRKEYLAAEKKREEREQFQRDNWTRDQQIKSAIANDPLTKDDPELAQQVYDGAMGRFLTRGGDVAFHAKQLIELARKRDERKGDAYHKQKVEDAKNTRGEGGARSPATKVEEGTLKDWEKDDGSYANKVLEKRGWK